MVDAPAPAAILLAGKCRFTADQQPPPRRIRPVLVPGEQARELGNEPIRILNIYAVKSCGPPLKGTLFFAPGQGGESNVELGFNLDLPDNEARVSDGLHLVSASSPAYFSRHTIQIAPGKQQVLGMFATTTRFHCSFRYGVTLLNGDKKEYQLIGNGDKPFRVSALADFPQYSVVYAAGPTSPDPRGAWARVNPNKYSG